MNGIVESNGCKETQSMPISSVGIYNHLFVSQVRREKTGRQQQQGGLLKKLKNAI